MECVKHVHTPSALFTGPARLPPHAMRILFPERRKKKTLFFCFLHWTGENSLSLSRQIRTPLVLFFVIACPLNCRHRLPHHSRSNTQTLFLARCFLSKLYKLGGCQRHNGSSCLSSFFGGGDGGTHEQRRAGGGEWSTAKRERQRGKESQMGVGGRHIVSLFGSRSRDRVGAFFSLTIALSSVLRVGV